MLFKRIKIHQLAILGLLIGATAGCSTAVLEGSQKPKPSTPSAFTVDFPDYRFDRWNREHATSTESIENFYRSYPRKVGASMAHAKSHSVTGLDDEAAFSANERIHEFFYETINESSGTDIVAHERADIVFSARLNDFSVESNFTPSDAAVSSRMGRLEFNPSVCHYTGNSVVRVEVRHRDNDDLIFSRNIGGSVRYLYESREPDCVVPLKLRNEMLDESLGAALQTAKNDLVKWWRPYGQIMSLSGLKSGHRIARINLGADHGLKPNQKITILHTSDLDDLEYAPDEIQQTSGIVSAHVERETAWIVIQISGNPANTGVSSGFMVTF